jgi:hypothetical protein
MDAPCEFYNRAQHGHPVRILQLSTAWTPRANLLTCAPTHMTQLILLIYPCRLLELSLLGLFYLILLRLKH